MNIVFEYPAYIVSIDEYDENNIPKNVTILIDVEGIDKVIKRSIESLGFKVEENMDLLVQGLEDNNKRYLRIVPSFKRELSQEEKNIIKNL